MRDFTEATQTVSAGQQLRSRRDEVGAESAIGGAIVGANRITKDESSPVDMELSRLARAMAELEARVSHLRGRLDPVIAAAPEPVNDQRTKDDPPRGLLCANLREISGRLSSMNAALDSMASHLTL